MTSVTGFVIPVPDANRSAYLDMARKVAPVFKKHGALRVVESWGVDTPDGKVTSFPMAVKAEAGESVLFSWIEWPSKEAADAGTAAAMKDPAMGPEPDQMPFDGMRIIWGGFETILDE